MASEIAALRALARLYGVQTAYYDLEGRRRAASPEALMAVLRALDAPIELVAGAPAALRERADALERRVVEPVVVAWDGAALPVAVRAPGGRRVDCSLVLDTGETLQVRRRGGAVILPRPLPLGYHRLIVEAGAERHEAAVIAAPRRAHLPDGGRWRAWGVFLPLYALRTERSWATADLTDLAALSEWVAGLGGGCVATLPLLAAFLDQARSDPSPYAPASRLFWNELYVDVEALPELQSCTEAQAVLASPGLRGEIEALRDADVVDYRRGMAAKRRVLEALARRFFAEPGRREGPFRRFLSERPEAEDYARFRATCESKGARWPDWPSAARNGRLEPADREDEAERYHLYAQWVAHEAMGSLARETAANGARLYLDLPLGVHPDSYDTWRMRHLFGWNVSTGSPPDPFLTKGQDWGFPPPHPERSREDGHRYWAAVLRHHFAHAGVLRIDHVMSLHRLYWVPHGLEARDGAYVLYPAEEMYAVLCLESHRRAAAVVGEDLGTVPRYVRSAMARHGVHRMSVLQFGLGPERTEVIGAAPARSVASLNTHDMPTFAGFWRGVDIDDRVDLGLLSPADAAGERRARDATRRSVVSELRDQGRIGGADDGPRDVVAGSLASLADGRAAVVLVNLEDLWLEERPQNVPGTTGERPNWRRKARHDLAELAAMPEVIEPLRAIDGLRRRRGGSR